MVYRDKKKYTEYKQFRYKKLHKERGLCVNCAREVIPGLTKCMFCWSKESLYNKRYYQANKERLNKTARRRRDRYKQENRCTACGAPLMDGDGVVCVNCNIQRQYPAHKYLGGLSHEVNHKTVTIKS